MFNYFRYEKYKYKSIMKDSNLMDNQESSF